MIYGILVMLHGNCGNKLLKEKKEISYFYKNKRILITGHTGFKGGWLSLFLNLMGAEVFGISDVRKKISLKSGFNSSLVQKEILTDINNVQPLNELSPIVVTCGKFIVVNNEQL